MKTQLTQLELLLDEKEHLAALCNAIAFLNDETDRINWIGLYLYKDEALTLGPFQGKVACTTIALDKGVCGASFSQNKILNVPDVHKFPGHIACDSASNSELVIPLEYEEKLYGVLDIDSPYFERFNEKDEIFLKQAADLIAKKVASY